MALAFIGLGSNQGDGRLNLRQAWKKLGRAAGVTTLAIASPYRTSPVAVPGHQPLSTTPFTNSVGVIDTRLAPLDLLHVILAIEETMGRDRGNGPDRVIDLDLLFYNELTMMSPELVLPHPEIAGRLFVLLPLCEIAPDHIHPANGKSSRQMLRELNDPEQQAKKISWQDKD